MIGEIITHQKKPCSKIPIILVGIKSDMEWERSVSIFDGFSLARKYDIPFLETSVQYGVNVSEAFTTLIAERNKKLRRA